MKKELLAPKLPGSELGEHPKKLGPLLISETVESSNFIFGIEFRFKK